MQVITDSEVEFVRTNKGDAGMDDTTIRLEPAEDGSVTEGLRLLEKVDEFEGVLEDDGLGVFTIKGMDSL